VILDKTIVCLIETVIVFSFSALDVKMLWEVEVLKADHFYSSQFNKST
jgi:hypothetical protein